MRTAPIKIRHKKDTKGRTIAQYWSGTYKRWLQISKAEASWWLATIGIEISS